MCGVPGTRMLRTNAGVKVVLVPSSFNDPERSCLHRSGIYGVLFVFPPKKDVMKPTKPPIPGRNAETPAFARVRRGSAHYWVL